jgi:hypothetical protein
MEDVYSVENNQHVFNSEEDEDSRRDGEEDGSD